MRLPEPCLVVLIGPSGSGKTTWARQWFAETAVVGTDDLRSVVGRGRHDMRATADAMAVAELVVERRLRRGLTTIVDSTGLDRKARLRFQRLASGAGVPCHAVVMPTDERTCRSRNRKRPDAVPAAVLSAQLRSMAAVVAAVEAEGADGFAAVHRPVDGERVDLVPARFYTALESARRQEDDPMTMRFGLQIGRFTWPGAPAETASRLAAIAAAAEQVGFSSISVMDHFVQIPTVGREWEDMLESTATLGYLAASTSRIRLGTLVTGITYRNLAHVAKIVATLDVLSGGRAFCGLGAAWFRREHELYGYAFPPLATRFELLEDALVLLPLMWGPGSPPFEGRHISVPAATCYPRPLQDRIPILVGGSGERKTLRLVAEHADACNLFGEPDVVVGKIAMLRGHCTEVGRDPATIAVTHLSEAAVIGADGDRDSHVAGTVDEHVGRYRQLAEIGVDEAIVAIHLDGTPAQLEAFAPVIAAFA